MSKRQRQNVIKFEQAVDDFCLPFLFDLPDNCLILVDGSCETDIDQLGKALETAEIVGIDTETEPRLTMSKTVEKTSLLQLAIRSKTGKEMAFIVDLLALYGEPNRAKCIDAMLHDCWRDRSVTKVAHALRGDAIEICESYPDATAFRAMNSALEISSLHRMINPNVTNDVSLKYLTKQYLHSEYSLRLLVFI